MPRIALTLIAKLSDILIPQISAGVYNVLSGTIGSAPEMMIIVRI